jgi:hypothetical protein
MSKLAIVDEPDIFLESLRLQFGTIYMAVPELQKTYAKYRDSACTEQAQELLLLFEKIAKAAANGVFLLKALDENETTYSS